MTPNLPFYMKIFSCYHLMGAANTCGLVRASFTSFPLNALSAYLLEALGSQDPGAAIPAVFLVASLCWLLRKTGSLLPPFVARATFNAFAATLLVLGGLGVLPESEQRSYSTHTFTQGDSV